MDDIENKDNPTITKKDEKLKSFIERIERLEEEKNNITSDIKEVFSEAKSICKEIGYPVLIKAAGGGGGKGMKIVEEESKLENL